MINKDDSKNAIWVAYCDLRADYEQLRQERDQLKVILHDVNTTDYRFSVEQLAEHDAQVIWDFCSFALSKYRYDITGFADEFLSVRQKAQDEQK